MAAEEVGQDEIRAVYYDAAVKQIAARAYKFKQACAIVSTSAWTNYFYRETATPLAAQTGNAIRGIPRRSNFPQAEASWTRVAAVIEKYGLENTIPWEDIISNAIDVRDRTLIKIAEGVVKAVDDQIWEVIADAHPSTGNPTNIQLIAITAGYEWDTASAAVIDDLLQAKQKIAEQNYPTEDLMCFVSPKGYRDMMKYLAEKGAQFPAIGNEVASNGRMGTIAGISLVVSNSVTASFALVVVPKRVATWKELVPLQTTTIEDKYKGETIRAVEMGVTELTDPQAAVLIRNTDAP